MKKLIGSQKINPFLIGGKIHSNASNLLHYGIFLNILSAYYTQSVIGFCIT